MPTTLTITGVDPSAPAAALVKAEDVVLAVDGSPVTGLDSLRSLLNGHKAGDTVMLRVRRAGKPTDLRVETRSSQGRTVLGIGVTPTFAFPFTVKISIDDIGGPSAGTMFALGIIDRLTPGDLTGGRHIAGTGTMDPEGQVGPIGGIQQKLVAARRAGAGWFLAPADDCPEVVGHVPSGLRVVRISTLHEARTSVEAIAAGTAATLPTCTR